MQEQEILQQLINELSSFKAKRYLPSFSQSNGFKSWINHVSKILKAADMKDELRIWEESLPDILSSNDKYAAIGLDIPSNTQISRAKNLLFAFLNKYNKDDKPIEPLFPMEIVENTKSYVHRIAKQVNICYENACYDACVVMLRRLIETLIIECYETHKIESQIKNSQGNYKTLDDIIADFIKESTFNLSRDTKNNLSKLKAIGDKSAHNRYFTASRNDIDKLVPDIRVIIPELVEKSEVKKK